MSWCIIEARQRCRDSVHTRSHLGRSDRAEPASFPLGLGCAGKCKEGQGSVECPADCLFFQHRHLQAEATGCSRLLVGLRVLVHLAFPKEHVVAQNVPAGLCPAYTVQMSALA